MRTQAAEFFVDVGFLNKEGKLLLQAVVVDAADRFGKAGTDFFFMRFHQSGEDFAQCPDDFFHRLEAL